MVPPWWSRERIIAIALAIAVLLPIIIFYLLIMVL
jgi:hypothetical protein